MRALITGITGFAGSHLAEHLLACGDDVLGCSRGGAWPPEMPPALRRDADLFCWDLAAGVTPSARRRVAAFAPQTVYHLAAISVPADCGHDQPAAAALAANVTGTESLLELAASLRPSPRLLFTSSCYVYAPVTAEQPVVDEQAAVDPRGGYGRTKWLAEQAVARAVREGGLDAVIARAFQHSGPRQSSRMILPDWARQFAAADSQPLRVVCRDTFLDLTDVRDIVRAYRALLMDGMRGTVYNVGSGVCRRSGDLLDRMAQLAGAGREVVELSPGRRQHPIADISRLVAHTAWQPQLPLDQTLTDILDYWLQRTEQR